MVTETAWLQKHIRAIDGYPIDGVTFRDITPLLGDADAFRFTIDALVDHFSGASYDRVVGIEARGFILAAAVAYRAGVAFVPIRKAGKLPWAVAREEYSLEYGQDQLEILATGGTAAAAVRLVEGLGAMVAGLGFLIELDDLGGRQLLPGHETVSLVRY
jgi:adenine phosphoribosyltransferase